MSSDGRLLELLREALVEPGSEPLAERVEAIRARAIAGRSRRRDPRNQWRGALTAAAVLAAFACGLLLANSLPRSLQRVASDIIPGVESPELAEAEKAIDELAMALDLGDAPAVMRTRRAMHDRVNGLDPEDRKQVEPKARLLDDLAGRFLGPEVDPTVPSAPTPAPTPAPSATPSSPFGAGPIPTPSPTSPV